MALAHGSCPAWPGLLCFLCRKPQILMKGLIFHSMFYLLTWRRTHFPGMIHSELASPRLTLFSDVDGIDPSLVPGTFILQSVDQIFTNI